METTKYSKPEIEVIEIEVTNEIMSTSPVDMDSTGNASDGAAYSNKRSFWGDGE